MRGSSGASATVRPDVSRSRSSASSSVSPVSQSIGFVSAVMVAVERSGPAAAMRAGAADASRSFVNSSSAVGASGPHASTSPRRFE